MNNDHLSYLLALSANICFASSSLVYAVYTVRVSVYWMNAFKATVCLVAITLTLPFVSQFDFQPQAALWAWFFSGLIGLNIADLFLLSGFKKLGAARTLVLFGFQPLILAWASYFLFDQSVSLMKSLSIILMIGCLYLFSLESYKKKGHWEYKGLLWALFGVSLDAVGVLLTRWGFDQAPHITTVEGQFFRCLGASAGFFVFSFFRPIGLVHHFRRLPKKEMWLVLAASLGGTYFSLLLYLGAVRIGHLASVASIVITGPLFASAVEHYLRREWPSKYFVGALFLFLIGFLMFFS